MAYKLNVGDRLPKFSGKDQEGVEISDEDLVGSPFVLYFYPKDDTSICTKEACSFRDNIEQFDDLDAIVVGISPDNAASHQGFIDKHDLNFTLICDENKDICRKFDVLKENNVERTTFVFDEDGVIRWIERPVNVEGHTQRVLSILENINESEEISS